MIRARSSWRSDPFDRLERIANGRAGPIAVGLWAAAEAIAFPIVPDVLLCLLVLAAPRRVVVLSAALLLGAVSGSLVLYVLTTVAPAAATDLVLAVPAVRPEMVQEAQARLSGGEPWAMAGFGPGTPLKVDTLAWALAGHGPMGLVIGVVVNRITRVGPVVLPAAVVGWLAPGALRRWAWPVIVVYVGLWVAVYAAYVR